MMTRSGIRLPRVVPCWLVLLALAGGGCGSGGARHAADGGKAGAGGAGGGGSDTPLVSGKTVALSLAKQDADQLQALSAQLEANKGLTASQLLAKHEVKHVDTLGYDPLKAQGIAAIQASAIRLDSAESDVLQQHGFVVSERQQYPHMLYGYDTIYQADLPVYVSADSILDSVHRSYDKMLSDVETNTLIGELEALLDGMRAELAKGTQTGPASADADFFLAVARSLVDGSTALPVGHAKASEIARFVRSATDASGHGTRVVFGSERDIDFSQFEPRGHYNDSDALKQYFRAMIWLGRMDLRLIETQPNGDRVFRREQLETMVLLHDLVTKEALAHWQRIDSTVETFVGKSDYMRLPEVDALLAGLGAKNTSDLAKLSDQTIAQAIIDGRYGEQLIASQLIVNASPDGKTLPLDRSFALFGQRFTVDSQVLSNVVYDRVASRFMPNPLDAAYAALGNDQAAQLLAPELTQYGYAPQLEAVRTLIDAHDDAFWSANLYNSWLTALRKLSPSGAEAAQSKGLPSVALTETWGRRVLDTQLASWAQLRHDTILYVKQSYTSGASCKFPDAYVDPYPEFFAALLAYANHGAAFADTLAGGADAGTAEAIRMYFDHLATTMTTLRDMAKAQRDGTPFTTAEMAFINNIVRNNMDGVCGAPPSYSGWYADLLYGEAEGKVYGMKLKPTIADVHTQPTDAQGNDVGKILHVGTGLARLMVVTVDTCDGPHAYAGVVSSYYEQITDHWKRLTDDDWANQLQEGGGNVPDVAWTKDFVAGAK